MICFPNAKINLGLQVLSKEPDGYHRIESLIAPVPFYDVIEFFQSSRFEIEVLGNYSVPHRKNTIRDAWEILHRNYSIPPISVKILKQIPPQSGLGGGSSDGAFLLKACNEFFGLGISVGQLEKLAFEIGSDCPFFIKNQPAIASGRGEVLNTTDINVRINYLAVVIPEVKISTHNAYESVVPSAGQQALSSILVQEPGTWRNVLKNDFEVYTFKKYPVLEKIKNRLYRAGAWYASLTGSGSALYGFFDKPPTLDVSDLRSQCHVFNTSQYGILNPSSP